VLLDLGSAKKFDIVNVRLRSTATHFLRTGKAVRRRGGAAEQALLLEENKRLKAEIYDIQAGGVCVNPKAAQAERSELICKMELMEAEHKKALDFQIRWNQWDTKQKAAAAERQETAVEAVEATAAAKVGRAEKGEEMAWGSVRRARVRADGVRNVTADAAQAQRALISTLEIQLRRLGEMGDAERSALEMQLQQLGEMGDAVTEEHAEELAAVREELAAVTAGPGSGNTDYSSKRLADMKVDVGIQKRFSSAPPRDPTSSTASLLSVQHMAAVMEGRGEGANINLIVGALERCGYLERLVEADAFQKVAASISRAAVEKVQEHWTARHSVHVWDRLELSRSQMETLHHLLSFVYDPISDKYVPIRVWENPNNSSDFVLAAKLASRCKREAEYREIASTMNITVGSNGRCERDAIECTSLLYTNFASALRKEYTTDRPAQPVLYFDGTGGALRRGICHGEIGCADFIAVGDSDAKQSRATLQPLFLYQGNDHAEPLRTNLDVAIKSYNKLVRQGCFDRVSFSGEFKSTPARAITAADMQGAKTAYGMNECSHSVWCKCQRGEGGSHHAYPSKPAETYAEVCSYCDEIGCEIKTHEELCSYAHYSSGVALGGAFTRFKCSCCGYSPTEAEWRSDLAAWHEMTDEQQAAARRIHMDTGDELNSTKQHYHQVLFMPPLPHHGMERCGVDNLHLIYLNIFKHLFKYTIHEGLPKSKKVIVREYCKAAGFYSYDAAADDEDPTKHWIGREVKRFLAQADRHVPFLLQLAAAPADCIPEMADLANENGEQEMEYDEDYDPTPDMIEEEELQEPDMMKNAGRWDNFLALVRAFQAPWPQGEPDTDEYRKGRAVEAFNLGTAVARDLLELKPTMQTWVPHILCFIVPRQMVELGDPTRRSCDACESYGALVKKLIKHASCRRRVTGNVRTTHGVKATETKGARLWMQTFNVGFIEQAFSRACVRESLQHGAANAPYMMRSDAKRKAEGKATSCKKFCVEPAPAPLRLLHSIVAEGIAAGSGGEAAGSGGGGAG
jgi:hypothetical protein